MNAPSSLNFHLEFSGKELIIVDGLKPAKQRLSCNILIIGGGVTGLTTAWTLLDAGYNVTVVAEKWASLEDRITSQIAGALWEWPPAVCGKHLNVISLTRSKEWCMTSYRAFDKLMQLFPAEEHGVRMRMANFFFTRAIEDMPGQLLKMNEICSQVDIQGFYRDRQLISQHAVSQTSKVVDSYQHLAPVVDTDHYMPWLRALVSAKGGRLVTARISGDLLAQEERLLIQYNSDIIVHATGLGAFELAADPKVYPLRGALIRVVNDGVHFPKVREALCVSHDDTQGDDVEDIVFIVPRNDNTLILGGLAQPNQWQTDLTLNSPEIVRMRKRCNDFVPGLANAEYDAHSPLVQGLRPFTEDNVRVEREPRKKKDGNSSRIIHTYGQGGAGFSLCFGCAGDVLGLVNSMEAEIMDSDMMSMVKAHL